MAAFISAAAIGLGASAATAGVIAAGTIGAAGSVIAAKSASNSQAASDAVNAENATNANATNERLFRLSRGGIDPQTGLAGNAVLPSYFGAGESALGQSTLERYNAMLAAIDKSTAGLQSSVDKLNPSMQEALTALQSRYNGGDLQARLAASQPFYDSRTQAAQAQVGSINSSLAQAMQALQAQRSAQGYFGSSVLDNNRLLAATLGARSQAAYGLSQANVSNQGDITNLKLADLTGRQDVSGLAAALQNQAAFQNFPLQNQINLSSAAQNPLNFFRIGPQAFQPQALPGISPTISNAQALGQGLGALGQVGTNYFMNQQLANAYKPAANPYATTGAFGALPSSATQSLLNPAGNFGGGYTPNALQFVANPY